MGQRYEPKPPADVIYAPSEVWDRLRPSRGCRTQRHNVGLHWDLTMVAATGQKACMQMWKTPKKVPVKQNLELIYATVR